MHVAGDTVVLRSVHFGHVRWAFPVRVVEETSERVALYLAAGTVGKRFTGAPLSAVRDLATMDWSVSDDVWTRTHRLYLTPFERAHSLDLLWDAVTWEFRVWYVNLQEPLRRTSLGFDTRDQALDIVIRPPDRRWRWKDEDHLQRAIANGRLSNAEAEVIWREGHGVIDMLDELLPTGWEDWRPPETWTPPGLPPDWDLSG